MKTLCPPLPILALVTLLSALPCWADPEISINDISVAENEGSSVFTVSLSEPSATPVTVDWTTQNGTAVEPGDYTAGTGTVTFPANVQTQTIIIPIINDSDGELAETFQVSLSNPSADATVIDAMGEAVIQESDITLLSWDPGTADLGSVVQTGTATPVGWRYFKINAQSLAAGGWRTALRVTVGEANLYAARNSLPVPGGAEWSSERAGSDGWVMRPDQFTAGETWYFLVDVTTAATWRLYTGDVFVQNMGPLQFTDSNSNGAYNIGEPVLPSGSGVIAIGPEGMRFFTSQAPNGTPAWSLWLNGDSRNLAVRQASLPFHEAGHFDHKQSGAMLLVPDYLGSNSAYFFSVVGNPGETVNLDSRIQSVTDVAFNSTQTSVNVTAAPFRVYRIQVPIDQIAWDVSTTAISGDPNVSVRRNNVPSQWFNDAFSEVSGLATDSVTLVPQFLTNDTWFITVYGAGNYQFTLDNGPPEIPLMAYVDSKPNDQINRAGWRFYSVPNISSQTGSLGWQLSLADEVPGTEIAIRRNAVPGRWNYRNAFDGTGIGNPGYVDLASDSGLLQQPGHQADIWYVGIYQPYTTLGEFTLNATAITPTNVAFNNASSAVTGQIHNSWSWFRIDVPAGVLGWDLRLRDVTGGVPQMVVARDVLPSSVGTTYNWAPSYYTEWLSGYSWAQGADWTGRYGEPDETNMNHRRFVAGMGRPLEPGTYYVGVYNAEAVNDAAYTLDSRGIGSGQFYTTSNLAFAAGSNATITNLAPREARYFKVTVPANTPSWEITLDPTVGEMLLMARRGTIPDPEPYLATSYGTQPDGSREMRLQKDGPERYLILPPDNVDYLLPGDYYLAVVGEGQSPADSGHVGTGNSSGLLTSRGSLAVANLGTVTVAGVGQSVSLAGGQVKGFRFTVPAGTATLEMRLNNRVGNPQMAVVGGLRLPPGTGLFSSAYYGSEGGQSSGAPSLNTDDGLITIANPPPGDYSMTISAAYDIGSASWSAASATILVQAVPPSAVTFNGGTSAVINQQALSWKFFRIDVPTGVLGWDLRLRDVTGGVPQIVVARDVLPSNVDTNRWGPSQNAEWPSGYSWTQGTDWTGRSLEPDESDMRYRRFVAGMGRPLEPGTHYVGVYNADAANEAAYTLDSRGIGSGQFYTTSNLAFAAGSSATITNLAPREARYFKVTIPANTPNWEITLDPTLGEMLLLVRRDAIPDPEGNTATQPDNGDRQARIQKDGPERYVIQPPDNTNFLVPGDYYLAVVSEGQSPADGGHVGTGNSSGVLTSRGSLVVTDLGVATEAGVSQSVSLVGAQMKGYRFSVPFGTATLEMRLNNRVGNPQMAVVGGLRLPPGLFWPYHGSEGGQSSGTPSQVSDDDLITIANPPPGDYSVTVSANSWSPASATLLVRQKPLLPLNFATSLNGNGNSNVDSKQIINGERIVYAVAVPATLAGQPVLGWKLNMSTTQGAAILRIYKNAGDTSPESMITVSNRTAIIVPPWLTPGNTWYAEVEGQGFTEYTITSSPVELNRNAWTLPVAFNQSFGDSGLQNNGTPLSGDQGVDLAQDDWHFYAIDIPSGNGGLLRTELQAISGNPDLYIREDGIPTSHHNSNGSSGQALINRSLTGTTSEYGNWVPLNGLSETRLRSGRWYLGVKAAGTSNVRYRLKASTGSVTDLMPNQIEVPGQTMAGGDWRYYRFSIPVNAPSQWLLTFSQQLGDVVMWIRDSVPPGDGYDSNPNNRTDWGTDSKNQGPYPSYDPAGTHTISAPQLRPGHTYFAGFRASGDATFTVSSSTGGGTIGSYPSLDFYAGSYSGMVPANDSTVVTVSAPFDATRWKHTATHSSGIEIRIEQGSLTRVAGPVHYTSGAVSDSSLNMPLTSWPWVPGQTYYIRFVNNTGVALPLAFFMNGRNAANEDEDSDGLPDEWEKTEFGNTSQYGRNDDPDQDGLINIIEFAFGLIPTSGSSFQLPLPQHVGGNYVISFTQPATVTGITYGAESSSTLLPGSWVPVTDTGSGGSHTFSIPSTGIPRNFMRLKVTSP